MYFEQRVFNRMPKQLFTWSEKHFDKNFSKKCCFNWTVSFREQKNLVLPVEFFWQRSQNRILPVQRNSLKTLFSKTFLNFKVFRTLSRKFQDFWRKVFTKVNEPGKNICKFPEENYEILLKRHKYTLFYFFWALSGLLSELWRKTFSSVVKTKFHATNGNFLGKQ